MKSILSPATTWRSFAAVASAALLLAGCGTVVPGAGERAAIVPAKSQFTATYPHDFPIHGIDVSKYQGDIDWESVRHGGITFAYIKATEGADRTDPKFTQNWEGSRQAGVKRGAYHFVYWCRTPEEEMANFIRTVPKDVDALPPVLDVEATPTSGSCKKTLYREQTVAQMRRMLQLMEQAFGKRPVVYTTVDFYQAILEPNELSDYPIWVRSTKYSPHVRYGQRKWHFWQFQSDAHIPGIRGNVDRNAFHGDQRQWVAFSGGAATQTALGYAPAATAVELPTASIPGAVAAPQPTSFVERPPIPAASAAAAPAPGPASVLPPVEVDE